jgi:hypothetical protein
VQTEKDRSIPSISKPSAGILSPTTQSSDAFSFFTKASNVPQQLYTGDRPWVNVKVLLETAGPVAVATKQNFLPVTSGKGRQLRTGVEATFTLPKGARLWIASTAINRVSVTVEPFPWLEQLYAALANNAAATRSLLDLFVTMPKSIANALAVLVGRK